MFSRAFLRLAPFTFCCGFSFDFSVSVELLSLLSFTRVCFLALPPLLPQKLRGPGKQKNTPMPKITKRLVDALRPDRNGKDVFVWDAGDGALKGFGIRMKPSGAASYFVQYRNKEGRTRRLVIGKLGTLTPDEARSLAGDALRARPRAATLGRTPRRARRDHGFRFMRLVPRRREEPHQGVHLGYGQEPDRTHVKPLIGRSHCAEPDTADIERMKADIIAGKTAKPRKMEGAEALPRAELAAAARTMGMLGTILEYARQSLKLIKDNPARGVKKPPDRKQRRFLTTKEITKLGQTMREAEWRERMRPLWLRSACCC